MVGHISQAVLARQELIRPVGLLLHPKEYTVPALLPSVRPTEVDRQAGDV
jgi:hypothetical protein